MSRILVTGAAGFIGRALVGELARGRPSQLTATDSALAEVPAGVAAKAGDLTDPGFLADLLAPGFDTVFHLASLPGAVAETDPALGQRINLSAALALAQGVAARRPGARLVFASSVAVYGSLTGTVTAQTPARPDLSYGAHKLMTEIFLTDLSRRGELAAISLRLPGIVARPVGDSGHGSAFMSRIFHAIAAGQPYDCPVPASATCWWLSRPACVAALIHAAALPTTTATVVQPPVLHLTVAEVAAATAQVTGQAARITWGSDARLTALFGAQPPLDASAALHLGFRADTDINALDQNALT